MGGQNETVMRSTPAPEEEKKQEEEEDPPLVLVLRDVNVNLDPHPTSFITSLIFKTTMLYNAIKIIMKVASFKSYMTSD